ncbi:MAG: hypothetical protein IT177_02570 [Acidobacteria bacterium]|nr:hypothetical protein [Acidobacteriota bacterium]
MHPRPTYDDANLILRLYEMRREDRMRQARAWFTAKCKGVQTYEDLLKLAPAGTDENASYRMVITYWDMVSSFIVTGILHKELFFQSGRELLLVWERVRDLLPSLREAYKDPGYLKNLETVGTEFAAHLNAHGPQAYEAFLKRVK